MNNNNLNRLADILVNYSIKVQPGEKVSIVGNVESEPLIREIFKEVLRAGGHPRVRLSFNDMLYMMHRYGGKEQLEHTDETLLYEVSHVDAVIQLLPNHNPHELTNIDDEKKKYFLSSNAVLMQKFFERVSNNQLRWVASIQPSAALAQEAKMAYEEYCDFTFRVMGLNSNYTNPLHFWEFLRQDQSQIADKLNSVNRLEIVSSDTHLTCNVGGRQWISCDGKLNFPDGEIFSAPVEDSVEGEIKFNYPIVYMGEEISDVYLKFEAGQVIEANASKGKKLLEKILEIDSGSCRLGEIAFGTNRNIEKFTNNILFDEKMGGTMHLALGNGYPGSGSKNQSAVHLDMVKDMRNNAKVIADGKVIYENGYFIAYEEYA